MRGAVFALALLAFAPLAQAAPPVQIAPVLIDLPAKRPIASVRLTNPSGEPLAFSATALAWTQENGADRLAPATDIIITPPAFVIRPGGEQIVRLGSSSPASDTERAYRLLFSQTLLRASEGGQLRMRYELSLPLFLAPAKARGDGLTVTQWADALGKRQLRVENNANRRVQVLGAKLADAPVSLPRYLLAGASVTLPAPQTQSAALRVSYADASYALGERDLPLTANEPPRLAP